MMVSCKNLSEVMDLSRYSYFVKLLRVTSYMFRFIGQETRNTLLRMNYPLKRLMFLV